MAGRHAPGPHKPAKIEFALADDTDGDFDGLRDDPGRQRDHQDLVLNDLVENISHGLGGLKSGRITFLSIRCPGVTTI